MSAPPPPPDVAEPLARLAAHAPAHGLDPDDLWSRGRRRHRGRALGGLAAAAVVAVTGAAVTPEVVARVQEVAPATSRTAMVLPDVIRQPGGWEPAFGRVPGRLSAVGTGQRSGLLGDRNAFWGVSATTGESRFLDLPGAMELGQPALSADGRRLAYWLATTADTDALGKAGEGAMLADGVAVLDLETGERTTWTLSSPSGLWIDGLAWAGDVLWWSAGPAKVTEGALTAAGGVHTWDVEAGVQSSPDGTALAASVSANGALSTQGGFVQVVADRRATVVTGDEVASLRLTLPPAVPPRASVVRAAVAPDGSRVAAVVARGGSVQDGQPLELSVGEVDGGAVDLRPVRDVAVTDVLGWRSPTAVVVVDAGTGGDTDGDGLQETREAWIADATDPGRVRYAPLVWIRSTSTPQVAADAWSAEVVEAPEAPVAPDPRVVGLVLLLGGFAAWRLLRHVGGLRERT